ncbi:hypothetical protein [Gangjinia marincola]
MAAKKTILVPVLALSTLVASACAIYFGLKASEVDMVQSKSNKEEIITNQIEKESVAKVDSLFFNGNYKEAAQLARELKQGQHFSNDNSLALRIRMANSLMKMGGANSSLRDRFNENGDSISDSLKIKTQEDSLINLLKDSRIEVARLKQRLRKNPASDYLSFKTSKGTLLHYVGAVENEQANGFGIALLETGSRYEGQWKNNQRHGYGKFFWDDGEQYEGEYKNDKREGLGTYYWDNGEKYVGEWKDDRRNGEGKFYNRRGKLKTSGIWKDDKLVEEK